MKSSRTRGGVTIRFADSFGLRDAINLPTLIRRLGPVERVTLEFQDVRWLRVSAFATLIPVLASMRRPSIRVTGLEAELEGELAGRGRD